MKYSLWLLRTVALTIVAIEACAWMLLQLIGSPPLAYNASYMNAYKYHPYMAFHTESYPVAENNNPQGKYDIAILGGSTAAGVGPKVMSDAYFYTMTEELQKRGKPAFFRNYAVPGLVSNQENAAYKNFVYSAETPKLVVSLTSFNDLYFYIFRTLPVGNHEFSYAFDWVFRMGYPDPPQWGEKLANMARKSSVYGLFHRIISGEEPIILSSEIFDPTQPNYPIPVPEERIRAVAKNFLDNQESTALMARRRGSKFVVILQPIIYYGGEIEPKPNEWFSEVERLNGWIRDVGHRKQEYDAFFSLVLAGLEKMKKEGLLEYMDYRALLQGPVYRDPVHFNEEASRFLGRRMAEDLAGKL